MAQLGTSKPRLSNLIKYEEATEHGYCREMETVRITAGADLVVGSVLGVVTATGKYTLRDPAAIDGSEVAAAISTQNITVAAATDTPVALLVNGAAIVGREALNYGVAHTAPQKATAESELAALGIKVRAQV